MKEIRHASRRRDLERSWIVAVGAVFLPLFAGVALAQGQRPAELERPGDPPAAPPGLENVSPSEPIRFGAFTSIQANVDGMGFNILGDAANEPSMAVDPTFPNRIAIGWRQFDSVLSNFRQAGWAYSRDGGRTWTFPGVLDPGVFRSDPVLDYDAQGNFYYNSLKVVNNAYSCDVFKSADGGMTWQQPVFAWGGDKQWMTIDRTGGQGHGNIYSAWSIFGSCCGNNNFTRSIDGGTSFSSPTAIPSTPIWGTMSVGPDGSLYVAGRDPDNNARFFVAKSSTAQDPTVTPTFDFTTTVSLGGLMISFAPNSPNPGGLLGQVSVATDHSPGPRHGHVYLLCSVSPISTSDPLDVHFARSTDGGATWAAEVRVNDDPLNNLAWQWFGTMSVAPGGRIDVVWNDTRNTAGYDESQLFYSFSMDGGVNWSANQQLSPTWNSHVGWPNQNKIGDYYDMVSDDVGAHLAWSATFNGEQDVYYLRIGDYDCNVNGVGDALDIADGTSFDQNQNGIPDECEPGATGVTVTTGPAYRLHGNQPNPFGRTTTIAFDVLRGGPVELQIFDVRGRLVRTLVDAYLTPGTRAVVWDGADQRIRPMPTGIYFYRLSAPGFVATRKMLLLR